MAKKIARPPQTNVRLPDKLKKMIQDEANLHGWSFNNEVVQRLNRSFIDQGVDALINKAVISTGIQLGTMLKDYTSIIHDHINEVAKAIGRPDLVINTKKGESNG
jgi:hypothetical protein